MRVKFYDGVQLENVNIQFNGNIVTIESDITPNKSGFNTYAGKGGVLINKYPEFNTVYRQLEGAFQLSNDGSHYEPPVPPPEPTPTESIIEVDGVEYNVIDFYDFGDISFLMENITVDEAIETFADVKKVSKDGIEYTNIVFSGAYEIERYHKTYVEVNIHIKTETELLREDVNSTEARISGEYDPSRTYTIDEYCTYNGNLYRFSQNSGNGILPTNTLYWTLCDIATELNKLSTLIKEI